MSTPNKNGIFAEHYLLKELLSAGNVAEVWKAEDWTAEGELVAVKIYAPHIRLDSHTLKQLSRELEDFASLDHPYLLHPYKFDVFDDVPYVVMPYMAQGALSQHLLKAGTLPEQEVAVLLTHISSALKYLHTREPAILHRFVSSDNILVSEEGEYVLTAPQLSSQLRNTLHKATGSQYAPATAYAAPELFSAHPVHSTASDIFSLGVVLYELCTGQVPWLGNGGISLLKGADVPYLPGPYSRILSNLVRACMNPNWEKRPSAGLLKEEANYFLEYGKWKSYGSFGNVTAESIVYKKRKPWVAILLASLLVLAALAGVYFYVFDGKLPENIVATMTSTTQSPGQAARDTAEESGSVALPSTTQTSQSPERQVTDTTPAKQSVQERQQVPATVPAAKPPTAETRPPAQRTPSYPRPSNLEAYLNGMLNEEIPLDVRDQWKPSIRRYFTPDAIIYATMNNSPLGSFGVAEFMDILLSTESASISIDDIIRDEEDDKIEELNVNLRTTQ